MKNNSTPGGSAFIVDNIRYVREVTILRVSGDFVTIRYKDSHTGIKVRKTRLFSPQEEAEATVPREARPKRNHWDYNL